MTSMPYGRAVEILLVEDSPADTRLTREAMKNGRLLNNLNVVVDGEEAMEYLRRQGRFANALRPDIVLLDLNLPRKDGREVLAEIKGDPNLCEIPVVVLTTSQAEEDIARSYHLHANCYITKPVDLDQFFRVMKSFKEFWFEIVKLPPNIRS
jgi:CheY-like chemotaxis protein